MPRENVESRKKNSDPVAGHFSITERAPPTLRHVESEPCPALGLEILEQDVVRLCRREWACTSPTHLFTPRAIGVQNPETARVAVTLQHEGQGAALIGATGALAAPWVPTGALALHS